MAEMAIGYGSEYQLLRYLGHHRNYFFDMIKKSTKQDEDIVWLDYPVALQRLSMDGEFKGIECFAKDKSINFEDLSRKWKEYWPTSGNSQNWDGIFLQGNTWYFVEAKAHLDEANQYCSAISEESINKIKTAFLRTTNSEELAEKWLKSNCYQLANRLSFIRFCKDNNIKAKLCYINFINGYRSSNNVKSENDWKLKWEEEYSTLGLTVELKQDIVQVYIDCEKA